ncbi:MAG: hypothetical protein ABIR53_06440 [Paraperlucidibaca sp.]
MSHPIEPEQTASPTQQIAPDREPMPASFKPFWRFLGLLILLTISIGIAAAIIGLALSD